MYYIETAVYMIEMLGGYMLMLTVMTFNSWLLIALVIGSTVGYVLTRLIGPGMSKSSRDKDLGINTISMISKTDGLSNHKVDSLEKSGVATFDNIEL